jgi:hypothetical protein
LPIRWSGAPARAAERECLLPHQRLAVGSQSGAVLCRWRVCPKGPLPVRDREIVAELDYSFQVAPWWTLQADAQYISHPSGMRPTRSTRPVPSRTRSWAFFAAARSTSDHPQRRSGAAGHVSHRRALLLIARIGESTCAATLTIGAFALGYGLARPTSESFQRARCAAWLSLGRAYHGVCCRCR